MGDKRSIERELNLNLEAYTSNLLLNKLTPGRNDTANSHLNILTSPIKTRRGNNTSSNNHTRQSLNDEYDDTDIVPLNTESKAPLRKGTPKHKKRLSRSPVHHKEESKQTIHSFRTQSLNIGNSSKSVLPDDEFDDDDYDNKANETLQDEIPADLLSPEKHIYPIENLSRSSITSTPKSSLYPKIRRKSDNKSKGSPRVDLLRSASLNLKSPKVSNQFLPSSVTKSQSRQGSTSQSAFSIFEDNNPVATSNPSHTLESEKATHHGSFNNTSGSPRKKQLNNDRRSDISVSAIQSDSKLPNNVNDSGHTQNATVSLASKFDSDEEELNVPEMTSTKFGKLLVDTAELKRKHEDIDVSQNEKKPKDDEEKEVKRQKLYPTLPSAGEVELESEKVEVNASIKISEERSHIKPADKNKLLENNPVFNTSLYPSLKNINSTEPSQETEQNAIRSRAKELLDTKKNNEATDEKSHERTAIEKPLSQQESVSTMQEQLKERLEKYRPESKSSNDESLGDPDHWIKPQWKRFLKTYKLYQSKNNDLRVFTPAILKYLRCDKEELKLKISFVSKYNEELKNGFKKEY